ncbi:preprotein translocase subunit Sec61beta [Candidatus Woesearchaeota archaeon]|nr:preprotein translocase subunit Sec61beta [Candidatus Woesearchaeota archaeon]
MADKIQMPSGMGGLVRYFDEYQSKIVMSPKFVVFLIALVIILEIGLHMFFA